MASLQNKSFERTPSRDLVFVESSAENHFVPSTCSYTQSLVSSLAAREIKKLQPQSAPGAKLVAHFVEHFKEHVVEHVAEVARQR